MSGASTSPAALRLDGVPAIETVGLRRSFGSVAAVDGLDLAIAQGRVTGFLGANGAGKTTTIRLLLGLLRPDAGSIRILGQPLDGGDRRRRQLLGSVGALVEMPSLYPHLTGRENLELTRRIRQLPGRSVDRALERVDLSAAADRPVGTYSLGMRQRLGLALALLADPKILILDEPTNGLDPAGILAIRDLLRTLARDEGVTVFLSSHLLAEIALTASDLVVIRRGRCVFQGATDDLRARLDTVGYRVEVDRPAEAAIRLSNGGWRVDPGPGESLLVGGHGPDDAPRLAEVLVGEGFALRHLSREASSLEDLFLELTGDGADVEDA